MHDLDAFSQLQLERERTLFTFYGYTRDDGSRGSNYFKLAHSLSEALADLTANPSVRPETYFVKDAFVEAGVGGEGPILHVELVSAREITAEEGDDL